MQPDRAEVVGGGGAPDHLVERHVEIDGEPVSASTEPTVSTYGEYQAGLATVATDRHPSGSSAAGAGFWFWQAPSRVRLPAATTTTTFRS